MWILGQRYTFYLQGGKADDPMRKLRGNLVSIYHHNQIRYDEKNGTYTVKTATLLCNNVETEIDKKTIISFPLDYVIKTENLDSICRGHVVLPSDILLHIDNYA